MLARICSTLWFRWVSACVVVAAVLGSPIQPPLSGRAVTPIFLHRDFTAYTPVGLLNPEAEPKGSSPAVVRLSEEEDRDLGPEDGAAARCVRPTNETFACSAWRRLAQSGLRPVHPLRC